MFGKGPSAVDSSHPSWQECIKAANALRRDRFPVASLIVLEHGSLWCRHLTSRLEPSHKDPVWCLEQRAKAGEIDLGSLSTLRAELPPSEDLSMREYLWKLVGS